MTVAKQIEEFIANGVTFGPESVYDGVIYPSGDGEPIAENAFQFRAIVDTEKTLTTRFRNEPAVYVAGDLLIYYRRGDNEARIAPDVFVAAGGKGKHPRHSWMTWVEGVVPQFVLEMETESTWTLNANEKRRTYAEMGVLEYWRFDPEMGKYLHEILIGERLANGEYVRMPVQADADGVLRGYSDFLKLDLCVRPDGQIRLYDPAAGEWLLSFGEAVRERDKVVRERDEVARELDAALRERDAEIERLRAALRAERGT